MVAVERGSGQEVLETWMKAQLDEHLTEPNPRLRQAIQSMLATAMRGRCFCVSRALHWINRLVERALQRGTKSYCVHPT